MTNDSAAHWPVCHLNRLHDVIVVEGSKETAQCVSSLTSESKRKRQLSR